MIGLGVLAVMNLLTQVSVQWYAVAILGVGAQSDALFVSTTVPQLVYGVLAGSLLHVLVPVFAGADRLQLRRGAWTFIWVIGAAFTVLCGLLAITAGAWVHWLVPGFQASDMTLATELTQVQLIGVIALAIGTVLTSLHHAEERFVWPEAAQFIVSLLSIAFAWAFAGRWGVHAFGWAMALRHFALLPLLAHVAGRPRLPRHRDPAVKEVWERVRPLIWGTSYYRLGRIFDRLLASLAVPGAISIFHLVEQLYAGGAQVLSKACATPLVTEVSKRAHLGDWAAIRARTRYTLGLVGVVCAAVVLPVAILGRPAIRFICQTLHYPVDEGMKFWWMMLLMSGMLVGAACGQVASSSYYALGETRVPTRIGVIGFTIGLGLKAAGFFVGAAVWPMGGMGPVLGLAAGTSLYYVMNLLLLVRMFEPVLSQLSEASDRRHRLPSAASHEKIS